MPISAIEVMSKILADPTNLANVEALTTDDVTYVSLNHDDPDLKRIMPWCGTGKGAASIVKTFIDVGRYWERISLDVEDLFSSGENVAMFGRFTYRSVVMGKHVTTPFAILGKVRDGRCYFMQFMEDTFATGASFRSGGTWSFRSNPNGEVVEI